VSAETRDDEATRPDREERLLRITAAICDGTPVDWAAELERSPDLRVVLRRLALIERIRNAAQR
jgi:hypothetical protein